MYESFCRGDAAYKKVTGPRGFVNCFKSELGYTVDKYGRPRVDLSKRTLTPESVSIKELAIGIAGHEWYSSLDPRSGPAGGLDDLPDKPTFEAAGGAPVTAGTFPNVSAFTSAVSGLLEIKVLEPYQSPEFIADQLVKTIPTRQRSEKMPGVASLGDNARKQDPTEAHPRLNMQERWVQTPETEYHGAGIDVDKTAVFFDLTNQVLAQAESLGHVLGLRKEKRILRTVLGIDNPYNYMGVNYNTYLTSGNWVNDIQNPLVDWTSLNSARLLFSRMTDQETGERIMVTPDTMLVMPLIYETANYILNATTVQQRTQSSAEVREGANRESGRYNVITSPIAEQVLIDEGGVAQADAEDYWYLLSTQKAFAYMENWSMNVQRANPTDYHMADHNIVFSMFVDEMGVPTVLEPRYAVRNKP